MDLGPTTRDNDLIAEQFGWTLEEAEAQVRAADVVGTIAAEVALRRPQQFVGSELSASPGGAPTLYLKGEADDFVRQLDEGAAVTVVLRDGQPYSFDELDERLIRVHEAVRGLGFEHVGSVFDITNEGKIEVIITLQKGMPFSPEHVMNDLPDALRTDVSIVFTEEKLHHSDSASFGGMRMTLGGNNWCTAGWAVKNLTTQVTGVTSQSVAHCGEQDTIRHPNVGQHTLTFKSDHWGQWGEIAWYTTPADEPALFYADTDPIDEIREVNGVEQSTQVSIGEPVCFFSRLQMVRRCSTLRYIHRACDNAQRFMEMNHELTINGDSGGGWSYNNRAWGSQHGHCYPGYNTMSFAGHYDNAINVNVRTQ